MINKKMNIVKYYKNPKEQMAKTIGVDPRRSWATHSSFILSTSLITPSSLTICLKK
jgi:hypothetical protein